MERNHIYTNVNVALVGLCKEMISHGLPVPSRLGDGTLELRHVGITLTNPLVREVVVPHRNASLAAQVAESMWVLAGRDDVEWLSNYLPRAKDFSDDGQTWRGGYGPRIRQWDDVELHSRHVDQLAHVVEVLRMDPNSRRAVISIYDPRIDVDPGKDIPCNDFLNFSLRDGVLDLHVFIRSNDLIWGWSGINAFEWSVLLEVVAGLLGASVGHLHFSITSLHVYDRHFARVGRIASQAETPWPGHQPMARFDASTADISTTRDLDALLKRWFEAEEQIRSGASDYADAINDFPEPMLRSFLFILHNHWTAKRDAAALADARTHGSAKQPAFTWSADDTFADRVSALHAEKHAAYGDSWKKRGESFSILPNIFRKSDRLASGGTTSDETQVDTAIDLLVYLVKYRWWLTDNAGAPAPVGGSATDEVERVSALLHTLDQSAQLPHCDEEAVADLTAALAVLETAVAGKRPNRWELADGLIHRANRLARHRVWQEGNATRRWEPGETPEKVGVHGYPYRPTQPEREPQRPATELGPLVP